GKAMTDDAIPTGDVHDFDFLVGSWTVAHRRLKARLADCREWEEFPGTSRCERRLGGLVNVDENIFPSREPAGVTVRAFDLAQRRWSIYWISGERGVLSPPVRGGFTGDEGRFYGDDVEGGRPVKVV